MCLYVCKCRTILAQQSSVSHADNKASWRTKPSPINKACYHLLLKGATYWAFIWDYNSRDVMCTDKWCFRLPLCFGKTGRWQKKELANSTVALVSLWIYSPHIVVAHARILLKRFKYLFQQHFLTQYLKRILETTLEKNICVSVTHVVLPWISEEAKIFLFLASWWTENPKTGPWRNGEAVLNNSKTISKHQFTHSHVTHAE